MNNDWQDFLRSNGAIFDRDTDEQFGTDSAVLHEFTRPVISLVNWMGIARVSGADAQTFLQAQCTGDIGNIEADTSRLSGYCDPKGRLLAIFRVLRDGKDFLLLTDSEILPAIVKRLKMYILRMKVELTLQDSQVVLGIAGPHAQQLAEKLIGKLRLHQNSAEQVYNVTAISTFMPTPRFLIVTNAQQIFAAWSNIRDHAILVGSAEWSLLEIRAGIARITPTTQQAFIPQSVNLDLVGGVSFSKGCYPGQEIVARVHYLGRLKQRMARATFTSGTLPRAGDPILSGADRNQRVGVVINAVGLSDSTGEMLATVPISSIVGTELPLDRNGHQKIRLMDFPLQKKGGES